MSGKIIFEWTLPPDHPNFTGIDDLPEAYRVIENPEASGGIIIEAKFRGVWDRPWNVRPLVRELLLQLQDLKEAAHIFGNQTAIKKAFKDAEIDT